MHRTRGHFLQRLCVVFLVVILVAWYLYPSQRHQRTIFGVSLNIEQQLPSGMQSYVNELRRLPRTLSDKNPRQTIRILCLILTRSNNFYTNVAVINTTWVSRCHKHFYVLNTNMTSHDIINTPYGETRFNLVHKIRFALTYLYNHHIHEFDWILKSDDDTYVIMENLQFLLSHYDGSRPGYLGFHFAKMAGKNGFMSGGAGYVFSNRALRRLIDFGLKIDACPIIPSNEDPETSEDIEIGRCLNISGVPVLSSLDSKGRETFHPYPLQQYIISNHLPSYMYDRAINFPRLGLDCCSQYSISFHYMSNEAMLVMDHLLYRTSVHGKGSSSDTREKDPAFKIGPVNIDEKLEALRNRTRLRAGASYLDNT